MRTWTLTNSQAPVHDTFLRELASLLGATMEQPIELISSGTWDEREARLEAGAIDLGWICGAPYVAKQARGVPLVALAAPVIEAARYRDRPIYFSDVIVRAGAPFRSFDELRGARWTYNEPHSHSGYHIVRHYLAAHGLDRDFFGHIRASGSHQMSVELVRAGQADASAIDSTVLEMLMANDPALGSELRVVEVLGPSPMPPLVARASLGEKAIVQLRRALTSIHETAPGRELLARARMKRLAAVSDASYDPIRAMLEAASRVEL